MEESLKKRLVGAAVLASLAVIFVPMLIGESDSPPELRDIPPPPEPADFASQMLREEVVRPQPVRVDIPSAQPEDAAELERSPEPAGLESAVAPTPTPTPTAAPATPPPPAKPQTGLTAWVVQVGSFSSRDNADKLVAKLRGAGFQAPDAERVELRGKIRYRVRVGPMARKEKAERLLPKIDQVSGTRGQVLRYP